MLTITGHEKTLRQMRCCVCRMTPVTLHHTHGGSMKEAGWHVGMGQRQNPWLQIPLHAMYHTGLMGIDSGLGVLTWEATYGTQMEHLQWLSVELGYDVFDKAEEWQAKHRSKSTARKEPPSMA